MKLVKLFVYRPKKVRDGKKVTQLTYRGRFRYDVDAKDTDIALGLTTKQNAESELRRIAAQREDEQFGRIAPKLQRDSATKPLVEHLEEFVGTLQAAQRAEHYVYLMRRLVTRLCTECGWQFPPDVSVNAFEAWRSRQTGKAVKTQNEYLNCARAFLNWMEHCERIQANPLRKVKKLATRGHEKRKRRSYSDPELARLSAVAGPRLLAYFLAAHAGLRRSEADRLRWSDLHLEGEKPFLVVRAEIAKNRKQQSIPLHPELLAELVKRKGAGTSASGLVLPEEVPTMPALRRDLKAAGIAYLDELGQQADFHALRHTFATRMAKFGVGQRSRQELMRHSSPSETEGYTDASHLLLGEAIGLLPAIQASPVASPANGFPCLQVSFAGTAKKTGAVQHTIENKGESRAPALNGTEGHEKENGSKGRARTYNPPVNSRMLYH